MPKAKTKTKWLFDDVQRRNLKCLIHNWQEEASMAETFNYPARADIWRTCANELKRLLKCKDN